MPPIYLFFDEQFGKRFLETAARFARHRKATVRAVLSGRYQSPWGRGPVNVMRRCARRVVTARRHRRRLGIPVRVVSNVNSRRFLASIPPGACGIVAGFNQIFETAAYTRFSRLVNVHPSVLPLYSGPIPSHWCLVNRETRTGFTLHDVADGPRSILYQETVPIRPGDDEWMVDRRIANAAVVVLWRFLDHLHTGTPWKNARVDAATVYRHHVEHATFPQRPNQRRKQHVARRAA